MKTNELPRNNMQIRTLTPQEWKDLGARMAEMSNVFGEWLRMKNYEGMGETDKAEYQADMTCAIAAVFYVAEFAADKCQFATIDVQQHALM